MALYMLLICGVIVFFMRRARLIHDAADVILPSGTSLNALARHSFHPVIMVAVQVSFTLSPWLLALCMWCRCLSLRRYGRCAGT